jgi:hypothetical protein
VRNAVWFGSQMRQGFERSEVESCGGKTQRCEVEVVDQLVEKYLPEMCDVESIMN